MLSRSCVALAAIAFAAQTPVFAADPSVWWGASPYNGWGEGFGGGSVQADNFPPPEYHYPDQTLRRQDNGFFSWSEYQLDCSDPLLFVDIKATPGNPNFWIRPTPAVQQRVCSAVNIPVVDGAFISNLRARGYVFAIIYPAKDNGNNRAYVEWANTNWAYSGSPSDAYWFPARPNGPTVQGYARLEGAPPWVDQFKLTPNCLQGYSFIGFTCTVWGPEIHNDKYGEFIYQLPSPRMETTLRLALPYGVGTIGTFVSGGIMTMLTDSWLAGTPTPPSPPPLPDPPLVAGASVNNLAFGSSGSGSASGSGGSGANAGRGGVPFDFTAFCNMPDPQTGGPRNPAWIASCLANASR